jgi:hypothetical protein
MMLWNINWVVPKHKPYVWFGSQLMLGYIKLIAVYLRCNFGYIWEMHYILVCTHEHYRRSTILHHEKSLMQSLIFTFETICPKDAHNRVL